MQQVSEAIFNPAVTHFSTTATIFLLGSVLSLFFSPASDVLGTHGQVQTPKNQVRRQSSHLVIKFILYSI